MIDSLFMPGTLPSSHCQDRVLSGHQVNTGHPLLLVGSRKAGHRTETYCLSCGERVELVPQVQVLRLSLTTPKKSNGMYHPAALVWVRHGKEKGPQLFPSPSQVQWASPPEVKGLHAPRWEQDGDVRRCDVCGDVWSRSGQGLKKLWSQTSGLGHHVR